ncbi:hypothetical protein QBC39DRAFT_326099 [Podospora conica]|nr:hypothetical protein QBC39DRAFT_326099 [Schizothecium conicum]
MTSHRGAPGIPAERAITVAGRPGHEQCIPHLAVSPETPAAETLEGQKSLCDEKERRSPSTLGDRSCSVGARGTASLSAPRSLSPASHEAQRPCFNHQVATPLLPGLRQSPVAGQTEHQRAQEMRGGEVLWGAEGSGPSPAVLHLISADTSAWRAEGFRFGTTFRLDMDGAEGQLRTYTAAVLCIFGRVSPDCPPSEAPVELSIREGVRRLRTSKMQAAVAGPGLPPGLIWPLSTFSSLQVQIMEASPDKHSRIQPPWVPRTTHKESLP